VTPRLLAREPATLVGLLREHAATNPDYTPYIFLDDGEDDARSITAGELDARARAIACEVLASSRPGDRALLLVPPGLDYIAAFFGCLYAGIIAVPAYPPDPRRLARTVPRLMSIVRSADASVLLTTRAIRSLATVLAPHAPELDSLHWIAIDDAAVTAWQPPSIDVDSIAMLQFTSGSTESPRGVVLTHDNLMANLAAIHAAFELEGRPPRTVSWLPPYHDMGLIGGVLGNLYSGGVGILMSPLHFLQQPVRWLNAITKYRADISGGPNFAYDLCVRRVDPAKQHLDLSTWDIAFNGAEVVRSESLERFATKFEPVGFRRTTWLPCYGLAEATLIATGVARAEEPITIHVERGSLERGDVVCVAHDAPDRRAQVSSGRACVGVEVAIVDPASCRAVPEGQLGEVWLAGRSVGRGYWGLAEETARRFDARLEGRGPFLRTGDLGFTLAGELFVTGRITDVIVVRGRNLFPDDIERVVAGAHAALRPGGIGAFAAELDDREQLVVASELEAGARDHAAIRAAIRKAVVETFDVVPHEVLLLETGTIPKTSSGKVQRHACRRGFAEQTLKLAVDHDEARYAASSEIVG
jgi:acyl-CoA synthetase (AMP-forming)/AMP-acid ligase II